MDNNQVQSFKSDKKFFDYRNYPQGFQRSGDFTRIQAQLLESKGNTLKALSDGTQPPQTPEEERFIATCLKTELPVSDIEKTWAQYLTSLRRKQIYFTASSAAVESSGSPESLDTDD